MGYRYPLPTPPVRFMPQTPAAIQKNLHALAPYDRDRLDELRDREYKAIARFKGTFDELEAALGLLHLGDHFGWKPMVLLHNKRTIRKYEEILDINIRDYFPEEGPSADRLLGYRIAKKLGNFWKAVSGDIKDDELKEHRRSVV
ncbi:MAG: hypothetical protein ABI216_17580 [Devosia sp.]